ncbi:hypothetical protein MP228_006728 [Amoeboaphelidium protococcarum]|nr:hypothetical protein MP228_006728 [Amoeboaphelidium protococcarum]
MTSRYSRLSTNTQRSSSVNLDLKEYSQSQVKQQQDSVADNQQQHSISKLGVLKLFSLTAVLLGLQFTWTIEMSYGTPYLTSFGLSHTQLTLVWLCGPLSGLIMQPIVGILSDRHQGRFGRRRPFIVGGFVLVICSLLMIAYVRDISRWWLLQSSSSQSRSGLPPPNAHDGPLSVFIVIFGFFVLDFSINIVQAASRALILDVLPADQQQAGNSWASGMISIGNIVGYYIGSLKLSDVMSKSLWSSSQQQQQILQDEDSLKQQSQSVEELHMKALTLIACLLLSSSVFITCYSIKERPFTGVVMHYQNAEGERRNLYSHIIQLVNTAFNLPRQLRMICMVQFFAWFGWFPFNFFSTEFIKTTAQYYGYGSNGAPISAMDAVRLGSRTLLILSVVSSLCAFTLPLVIRIRQWKPQIVWTFSLFLFACILIASYIVVSVYVVYDPTMMLMCFVCICGLPLAVTMWVPYALIGEYLSPATSLQQNRKKSSTHDLTDEEIQLSLGDNEEQRASCSKQILPKYNGNPDKQDHGNISVLTQQDNHHLSSGIVLGIHNVYTVLPQILSSLLSSLLFYMVQDDGRDPGNIGLVWMISGLFVVAGAILSCRLVQQQQQQLQVDPHLVLVSCYFA